MGAQKKELQFNKDFVPFSFSSSGAFAGPVVFAGYGASADEFGYDDYSGIDVKDKIVVLLRYEPGLRREKRKPRPDAPSALVTKAINARNHGAKAVVIVNGKMTAAKKICSRASAA